MWRDRGGWIYIYICVGVQEHHHDDDRNWTSARIVEVIPICRRSEGARCVYFVFFMGLYMGLMGSHDGGSGMNGLVQSMSLFIDVNDVL